MTIGGISASYGMALRWRSRLLGEVMGDQGVVIPAVVPAWVDMDGCFRETRYVVQEVMVGVLGDVVGVSEAQIAVGHNGGLGAELVAEPADADRLHGLDAGHVCEHVLDSINDVGID